MFAEQREGTLKRGGLEALSQARRMASGGMGGVTVVVVGAGIAGAADQAGAAGADRVLVVDHPDLALYAPAAYAGALASAVKAADPAAVLIPASAMGKDLAPRLAARLVFFLMSTTALQVFLDSPYNLVSHIKMFYFFAEISRISLIVIGILFLLSIVLRGFWCRYLCPYGALLGITSLLSPNKIKRNSVSCIDCGLCNKACPSFIKVDKVKTVISDECTSCLNCVDVCPVADTLQLETIGTKKKINKKYVAIGVVSIFMLVTGFGTITGNWQNKISKEEYLELHKDMDSFGHPTGTEAVKKFNEDALKNNADAENNFENENKINKSNDEKR